MQTTLKNIEIETIVNSLDSSTSIRNSSDPAKKLPIKLLWKIEKNYKTLRSLVDQLHAMRDTIVSKYSTDEKSVEETLESGETIRKVKPEFLDEWRTELEELAQVENDVEIDTISITEIENLDMVPGDFATIKFMVEE